jgi:hypothetical protein
MLHAMGMVILERANTRGDGLVLVILGLVFFIYSVLDLPTTHFDIPADLIDILPVLVGAWGVILGCRILKKSAFGSDWEWQRKEVET